MATLDLTATKDRDGFVIYFGGEPNEVDAYTFANALVATADAFREINAQAHPGVSLELRLEALGEGSFKARVREKPSTLQALLKYGRDNFIMPIFVAWFYTTYMAPKAEIVVNDDEVIIQTGEDRVIVPRKAYEQAKRLPDKARVSQHVARAIAAVERDASVTSFGILKDGDDGSPPALMIPREEFAIIRAEATADELGGKRLVPQRATISILKAFTKKTDRKCEFVWQGVKISAPIKDPVFWSKVENRTYLIGNGDALEVTLVITQVWDEPSRVWMNTAYSVEHVFNIIPGDQTRDLGFK